MQHYQCFLFYSFSIIGEGIVASLRKSLFAHYLKLHLGYFDVPAHSPGALLTKLSSDTTKINGNFFQMIGTIFQSFSSMFIGLGICFYYEAEFSEGRKLNDIFKILNDIRYDINRHMKKDLYSKIMEEINILKKNTQEAFDMKH